MGDAGWGMRGVPDVLILVGSESDKPRIEPAFEVLSKAGVSYEFHVSSAHRQPDQTAKLVSGARGQGFKVIIAGAGLSAALPGFAARSEERRVGKECRSRWSPYH